MKNETWLIDVNVAMFNAHKEIYWTESQAASVCNFLVHQPTIDAVQVTRCRDCRYGKPDVIDENVIFCIARQNINTVKPDEFCNLGERDDANITHVDRCVACGEPVPEGRQVCCICEHKG